MLNAWNTYKQALFTKMPSLRDNLNACATLDKLIAAEQALRIRFPIELKELYFANNGDDPEAMCGVILGFHFLSLDEVVSEVRHWAELAGKNGFGEESSFTSKPEGFIKRQYANAKWIPICADGGGNFIGLDLDPDTKGRGGQVINFGRDEQHKEVFAYSLNAFFERLTRIVNSDQFYIGEFDGEEVIFLGVDSEDGAHLTDYLKKEDSVK